MLRLRHRRPRQRSLVSIARRDTLHLKRGLRELLTATEATIEQGPARRVAVLVDAPSSLLPRWLSMRWPKLRVVCIATSDAITARVAERTDSRVIVAMGRSVSFQHSVLTAHGPFDVVVDAAARTGEERVRALEVAFLHLRRGGAYLIGAGRGRRKQAADVDDCLPGLTDGAGRSHGDHWLVPAIAEVRCTRGVTTLSNRVTASPKLRYYELDEVLRRRPAMGRLISSRPSFVYHSTAQVTMNLDRPPFPLADEIRVPSLGVRAFEDVTCLPHQVLVHAGILLTDSYRHYLNRTLTSRYVDDFSERFARRRTSSSDQVLRGPHFYLGSEFPQHFGHVVTEQLSRLWAWPEIKRAFPEAKALLEIRPRRDGLQPWEVAIFHAAGVAEDDLVAVRGAVRVETLIAAAPMFVNPHYAHPELASLWSLTGDRLAATASDRDRPDKIFLSRRKAQKKRACRNSEQVERFFAAHGYQVMYPEDHTIGEQVRFFRAARSIAGLAGSGLFNLCFCEPKQVIMIWPESYSARNEYLMSSVIGHDLTVFWCTPDVDHPEGDWDVAAYQSTYAFDFDRDGPRLAEILRSS